MEDINLRNSLKFITKPFIHFFRLEASSGIVLIVCAIIAMLLANSPISAIYEEVLHYPLTIGIGTFSLQFGIQHWVNDGLMVVFFFVIGLEIKREFLYGELKSIAAMILPVSAALGGMIVPAVLYIIVNYNEPTVVGWGIPMATDIAFALGVMTLAARDVPFGMVIFLTALAIVDDLGAIVVIAFAYSGNIIWEALIAGIVAILFAFMLNRLHVKCFLGYLLCGVIAWICFIQAGIHPTIAGVLLGISIPACSDTDLSLLHRIEHKLEPWSAYGIMPIFALANAGISVSAQSFDYTSPVFIGIIAGLCIGKLLGIAGMSYLLHRLFRVPIPGDASSTQVIGISLLGGIGFTMSMFIAALAFTDSGLLDQAKLSILIASLLSGFLGAIVLRWSGGSSIKE